MGGATKAPGGAIITGSTRDNERINEERIDTTEWAEHQDVLNERMGGAVKKSRNLAQRGRLSTQRRKRFDSAKARSDMRANKKCVKHVERRLDAIMAEQLGLDSRSNEDKEEFDAK